MPGPHNKRDRSGKHARQPAVVQPGHAGFELLGKVALGLLCDRLPTDDPDALEQCIAFFEAETYGLWHGRARAKMARRLKHCRLAREQQGRVIRAVLGRLASGRFSEQFKDQLRFVLHVAPGMVFAAAHGCEQSEAAHVRRYAVWILRREPDGRPLA